MPDFWTSQASQAPDLNLLGRFLFILLPLVFIYATLKQVDNKNYIRFFKFLQVLQIVSLYGWYIWTGAPLAESLPLYHCRLAMFFLLFLPGQSVFKSYFARLGLGGSLLAFAYPVFDPFPLFHVTTFSFVFGHLALLVNALIYLCHEKGSHYLSFKSIVLFTFFIHLLQLVVNAWTGGNYGFMSDSPLLGLTNPWLNLLIIGIFMILLIRLNEKILFTLYHQKNQAL